MPLYLVLFINDGTVASMVFSNGPSLLQVTISLLSKFDGMRVRSKAYTIKWIYRLDSSGRRFAFKCSSLVESWFGLG